jgi:hypothetical protein
VLTIGGTNAVWNYSQVSKKYGNGKSRFAAHLLENKHSICPMDNIMETLHTTGKGRMMDTLERFYIFLETKINN